MLIEDYSRMSILVGLDRTQFSLECPAITLTINT